MRIGVPKETKAGEHRLGLTPGAARELAAAGHVVLVETSAGTAAGFTDQHFEAAGARIVPSGAALFEEAELIVKVKEPQPEELERLEPEHILFCYLHLAANRPLAAALLSSGCAAVAYETVTSPSGALPLLAPMSRIAGRLAIQAGAHFLEKTSGGLGVLLGGLPGVAPELITIIGAGVAGTGAAEAAIGIGADVVVLDTDVGKLEGLGARYEHSIRTEYSTAESIGRNVERSALVIGTVLIPGRSTPKLVTREMMGAMRGGAVAVDVAIDQGGCFETSRPTTHDHPVYNAEGVLHYCVSNMPAAVPRTSTLALVNATLPYIRALADRGWEEAMRHDPYLATGLNIADGAIRHAGLAAELSDLVKDRSLDRSHTDR